MTPDEARVLDVAAARAMGWTVRGGAGMSTDTNEARAYAAGMRAAAALCLARAKSHTTHGSSRGYAVDARNDRANEAEECAAAILAAAGEKGQGGE